MSTNQETARQLLTHAGVPEDNITAEAVEFTEALMDEVDPRVVRLMVKQFVIALKVQQPWLST